MADSKIPDLLTRIPQRNMRQSFFFLPVRLLSKHRTMKLPSKKTKQNKTPKTTPPQKNLSKVTASN